MAEQLPKNNLERTAQQVLGQCAVDINFADTRSPRQIVEDLTMNGVIRPPLEALRVLGIALPEEQPGSYRV